MVYVTEESLCCYLVTALFESRTASLFLGAAVTFIAAKLEREDSIQRTVCSERGRADLIGDKGKRAESPR
jgi:hypothetical protein